MKKPQQIGPYRILRELGKGGMGVVYLAEHRRVKNQVAIKLLLERYAQDPQIVARLRVEAMAANLPLHPGIARVLESDVTETDRTPYIVMEYVDGESLRRRLRRQPGGLREVTVVRFGKQVADALAAAHSKKIVHRDIKPENIMITRDDAVPGGERAKVLDFGIASVTEEHAIHTSQSDTSDTQVQTGPFAGIIGTVTYIAPEQCQHGGHAGTDDKVDVYALGVVLYEMLTGRPPFMDAEAVTIMHMHLHQAPPAVRTCKPEVSPELSALVQRMLSKQPAQRPSMREVSAELTALERPGDYSLPMLPRLPPRPGRRWLLPGIGVLLAAAATLLLSGVLSGPALVRWRVNSVPGGAEVITPDGVVLGVTPWKSRRARDVGKVTLTLRLRGYAPANVTLDYSEEFNRTILLQPEK